MHSGPFIYHIIATALTLRVTYVYKYNRFYYNTVYVTSWSSDEVRGSESQR